MSCQDKEATESYSEVYGRLLIDRAVKAGLLKKETDSLYLPVEDVEDVLVGEYYNYPECHISVTDLRERQLTVKGRLCTARGMNHEQDRWE